MPALLASACAAALVLSHVNVVDVETGAIRRDVTVTVADGRIRAIDEAGTRQPRAAGTQAVDASGKYLIPGLWDMHVHWYELQYLPLFLANGVTGVRQMFGYPLLLSWRTRIARGELVGPRQIVASPIVDGPRPVWSGSLLVADAKEGHDVVRRIKRDGYDFVKVYNRLPRDGYFAILEQAKREGISVEGHVPAAVSAREASDGGQKVIEHLTRLLAATATEPEAAALFARFRENGTWQCPTLTVLRARGSIDQPAFTQDPRLKYIPPDLRAEWTSDKGRMRAGRTAEDYARARETFRTQLALVGAMQRAGVQILAGTDTRNPFCFPGFSLHDELALLVAAGLTPLQSLQAATVNPARYLGKVETYGTVAPGKVADLILLEANPLDDIKATTRIAAVIAGGRLFDRAALDAMLRDVEQLNSHAR